MFFLELLLDIIGFFLLWGREDEMDEAPMIFNLKFDDGRLVRFIMRDGEEVVGEFLRLKLMWHSNFDRLELIPYADKPFEYTISRLDDSGWWITDGSTIEGGI